MKMLDGKVAIITGASSGIGRAAALLFAQHGAAVVVGARRRTELDGLVTEIEAGGGQAAAVDGDVTDEGFAMRLTETAVSKFGGLDIALNNAGTLGKTAPFREIDRASWEETLTVNLTGAFLCARKQLSAMEERGGGSLVFTSSIVGHTVGFPGMAAYAASKAGLVGLTQALAAEYGPKGIRVNALLPGGTDTDMGRESANTPEAMDFVKGIHALKRIAEPQEIAAAALFLASGMGSFVTGTAMLVDGGVSINRT
ncbi:SDR family oxidoreductase [Rhodospirillaceae bacterium KN72]|uniref:SDR family oxidoreductase n=1 Tax=Pacificispira spongiicola TaxID=2729598 RepID=A0A7Y0DZS0_9PROT|nr:SDR family oxidoreductase [Pacificispira spongiicola]NMM44493.1 SDR family oxidoreductase [Pacificispira spongiicola]